MPMRRLPFWLLALGSVASACSTAPVQSSATTGSSTSSTAAPLETTTDEPTTVDEPPTVHQPEPLVGELTYEIVAVYPHLTSSFTQGLEFLENGQLVESLGRRQESGRAIVDLESGEHLSFEPLDDDLFGEGVTQVGTELFQLTWLSELAIVSDSDSLVESRSYRYSGQGWGICWNGTELAMSDGSTNLTFRDPTDFSVTRVLPVATERRDLLGQFNELECIGDQIWANVYQRDHIVAINPESGEIEAWVDLSDLVSKAIRTNDETNDVLNGIAYRTETGTFFVTGKLWPELFELRLSVN